MPEDVKIVKVGSSPPPPPKKAAPAPPSTRKHTQPKFGVLKGGKTARNAPRFKGVKDPAKSPPVKASPSTLRILTEKGLTRRRKVIKKLVESTPVTNLRSTLKRSGLPISDKTPDHLVREIAAGGMEAGMIPT
jgi:hypothetical protein